MAKNKPFGDNARRGEVKNREQVFNPKIKRWVKIDTDTHLFMDQKSNGEKFKGVRKYK
ncbi:MAG: hypothetical protein P4L62_04160 [Candidatus Pacebacteria bacterium]|nr:hypothetical protein [Candidatus Paceibacterota bacterium]MDR3583525.1 hypothetical protein [Candidatus Paceibacterota bacterium]